MQTALRPAQTVEYFGTSHSQIYSLINQGELPATLVCCREKTVFKTDVDNCIQQNLNA